VALVLPYKDDFWVGFNVVFFAILSHLVFWIKMNNESLVTVFTPTKNRLSMLKRAVKSVNEQSYKNIELIIVNDGSDDGTFEYLESIKSPLIKVFHNIKSMGGCYSRNLAIKNANGYYITGLDDDDYFLKNRVLDLVSGLSSDSSDNLVGVYGNCIERKSDFDESLVTHSEFSYLRDLLNYNSVGNQILTYTALLRNVLFDEYIPAWQDWEMYISLLRYKGGKSYYKNINTNSYVQDISHELDRITNQSEEKIFKSYTYLLVKHKDVISDPGILKIPYLCYPQSYWGLGDYILVLKSFKIGLILRRLKRRYLQ
jgi:glycosyltransferase involved in cell wall biosynthesis